MLKDRIITGVIGLLILLSAVFFVSPDIFRVMIAILFLIVGWEWSSLIQEKKMFQIKFISFLLIVFCYYQYIGKEIFDEKIILYLSLLFWLLSLKLLHSYPYEIGRAFSIAFSLFSIISGYIAVDWLFQYSVKYFLIFLLMIWMMDIGSYFGGKKFGKSKLAILISPKKTWEGLFSGLFAITLTAFIISEINNFDNKIIIILFSICMGLFSVVGDLVVSVFKRNSNKDDSGKILPGHGGFLDRIDSILPTAPLFAIICINNLI
tara:strand:- start:7903 stop:8691 length:789 start_codon:yes stop_codon:yes gene_type:complete